jgi:hypothetical protein
MGADGGGGPGTGDLRSPLGPGVARIASHRDWRWGTFSFGVLLALACATYGRIFNIRPLGGDNLYILSWASRAPASALLRVDPLIYPEWRPLPYQSIWLEYRWWNIDHVAAYFVVNLLIWTTCAWLIYLIVDRILSSRIVALFTAALVLTDSRPVYALLWIVERQTSMACLFGLGALFLAIRTPGRRLTRLEWTGVLLLLLASALSKEYGLAFAGALALYSLRTRRTDVGGAAITASVVYVALRLALTRGATGSYCDDEAGYFFAVRHICYDIIDIESLKQMAYNVATTGLGSLLPGWLSGGRIGVDRTLLAVSTAWLALAALGWWKGPRVVRIGAWLIVINAALSFVIFRSRNQVIAMCGLNLAVGAGLAAGASMLQVAGWRRVRWCAAACVLALLVVQTVRTRAFVSQEVDAYARQDPCIEMEKVVLDRLKPADLFPPAFIERLKVHYGMSNPTCEPR